MSLLSIKDAVFTYPQGKRKALNGINLEVNAGDYIALLGNNGSGKSTLSRMMAGFFDPDSGSVKLDKDVLPGIVFQQPKEQIVAGVVERDTAFGPQNLRMSKAEIELRTIECLSVVALADRALSRTFELSLGQTQRLSLAGILALFPDLLILDEVTAMIDPGARQEIIQFIDQWNVRGHTIIHVTHDLDEALHAKRIIVMEEGNIVFDGPASQFNNDSELKNKIFGTPLTRESVSIKQFTDADPVSLEVKNLSFSYPERTIFEDISFSLKKGSLTALTGPSGCGKSTMFECLSGLLTPTGGTIKAVSRPVLSLQESEASLFEKYAADDVAFGPKNQGLEGKKLVKRVKKSMELAGLDYKAFADRGTFALSGGEKRKLSLAGIIALDSDIMIFDEPTSALDPESRKTVLLTLRALADQGKTVLFSTHRMEEADIADFRLKWTELTEKKTAAVEESAVVEEKAVVESEVAGVEKEAGPSKSAESEELVAMEPIQNAKIIGSLHNVSANFMAPPSMPDSFISRLPDWAKIVLFLCIFTTSIVVKPLWLCGVMLVVNFLYALLSKYPLRKPLTAFRKLFWWILIFALINFILLNSKPEDLILFQYGWFTITDYKLELLGKAFLRGFAAIFSIGTFIYTTSEREILDGLSILLTPLALIKVPVRYFVLVIGIIFRFIPLLLDELCGIIKTQIVRGAFASARGFGKVKIIIPLFVPIMLQTFRKAQTLADALTARYFN